MKRRFCLDDLPLANLRDKAVGDHKELELARLAYVHLPGTI
jgi:hypothetical protein